LVQALLLKREDKLHSITLKRLKKFFVAQIWFLLLQEKAAEPEPVEPLSLQRLRAILVH
jgi:hypothetical protein